MAKVICKLPNASTLISGIKFVEHKLGMISEEISDEVAERFTGIKGYVLHSKPEQNPELIAALRDELSALGVDVKGSWKEERLQAEIAKVKAAQQAQASEEGSQPAGESDNSLAPVTEQTGVDAAQTE